MLVISSISINRPEGHFPWPWHFGRLVCIIREQPANYALPPRMQREGLARGVSRGTPLSPERRAGYLFVLFFLFSPFFFF